MSEAGRLGKDRTISDITIRRDVECLVRTYFALTGGARWDWAPNLLLWAALVAGAVCGASAYHWINLAAVWFAAALALILSGIVAATIHL